jgi:aldehyde dehydrogenase (NAD+)
MSLEVPLLSAGDGVRFRSVNPTQPQDVVAEFVGATPLEIDRTAAKAVEAFGPWSRLTGATRGDALYRWADAIAARSEQLALAIVREVGKPLGEARGEVGRCVAILRYYAGEAVRECGDVIPPLVSGALQFSVRAPHGVVALITPWNFPLAIPLWKAAPALAVGNTVVLKSAEESVWCAALLAETAASSGLPEGVFNIVYGAGETGAALLANEHVRCVSFTGSAEVGALVATTCAGRNIKYQTEMGGKNPALVLADADLPSAANLVASGAMRFAGQKCTATSRVIVDRKVYGPFVDHLRAAISSLSVGDPADLATAVGPVITVESQERILSVLRDVEPLHQVEVSRPGYFVAPTTVAADRQSPLAQFELFGPGLAVIEVDGSDEAIAVANDSAFGLSASLFTKDLSAALSYIHRIEAGMVRVNADTTGVDPHAPFGGVKGSSSHSREQGAAAKEFYTEIRTVQINP